MAARFTRKITIWEGRPLSLNCRLTIHEAVKAWFMQYIGESSCGT
jgi:hypothetical protein